MVIIPKTKEEKIQLLNETVAYYSENTARRCVIRQNMCYYYGGSNKHTKSDGCAIGRLIPKELAKALDKEYVNDILCSGVDYNFDRMPIEVQAYGKKFLTRLQNLHDYSIYWFKDGLSSEGHLQVENLIEEILYQDL